MLTRAIAEIAALEPQPRVVLGTSVSVSVSPVFVESDSEAVFLIR